MKSTPLYSNLIKRILSAFVAFSFMLTGLFPVSVSAQSILNLPIPGSMVKPTWGFIPTHIKGITIHPENALSFDFIIDTGHSDIEGVELEEESLKLIKYFMAALTVPEEDMWVNLSPYENDRIIPQDFGYTAMGRDLLAQDYLLKQITASLMYPEDDLGGEFWDNVYERAFERYGTTEIPINTFNKIWIVPEAASVYEHENSVFIIDSRLKIMLEEDYLALEKNLDNERFGTDQIEQSDVKALSSISSEVVREILIPAIEKEVNEGETFTQLRQIYNAMIMATWYKQNLKESILGQVYVDKNKTSGVDVEDKQIKQKIYDQYIEAFKKGVYDYTRDDFDPATQQIIPRKYFAGGFIANSPLYSLDKKVESSTFDGNLSALSAKIRTKATKALANSTASSSIYEVGANVFGMGLEAKLEKASSAAKGTQDNAEFKETLGETFKDKIKSIFDVGAGDGGWMKNIAEKEWLDVKASIVGFELEKPDWANPDNWKGLKIIHSKEDSDYPALESVELVHESFMNKEYLEENPERFEEYDRILKEGGWFMVSHSSFFLLGREKFVQWLINKGYPFKIYYESNVPKDYPTTFWWKEYVQRKSSLSFDKIMPNDRDGNMLIVAKKVSSSIDQVENKIVNSLELPIQKIEKYGGINLDANLLDLQIKRDGKGIPLPISDQPLEDMNIQGFLPVIINITPIQNLPLMLGIVEPASQGTERDVSYYFFNNKAVIQDMEMLYFV
ncbi:hypothetical protein MNBD_UNCLBAC01-701 [hydrothermal vent metagenome]|uniref:Uncharacterized protein n=1 Tax=hydrothermal vent metagenome TaxID=652676 RepID=A0A3B1DJ23_9ZZZZ